MAPTKDKVDEKASGRQLKKILDKLAAAFTALSKGDIPKASGVTAKGPLNTAVCRIIDQKFPAVRKAATDRGPADKAKLVKYLSCDLCKWSEYLGENGDFLHILESECDDLITRMGPQNATWTPPDMPKHWELLEERYQYPSGKNAMSLTETKLAAAGKQKATNDKKAKRERESAAAAHNSSSPLNSEDEEVLGLDAPSGFTPPSSVKKGSKNSKGKPTGKKRTSEDLDEHEGDDGAPTKKAKKSVARDAAAPKEVKGEPSEDNWNRPQATTPEDVERALSGLFKVEDAPDDVLRAGMKLFKHLHSVKPNFDITKIEFSPGREVPEDNSEIALDNKSEPKDHESEQKNEAGTNSDTTKVQSKSKGRKSKQKDESVPSPDLQNPAKHKSSEAKVKEVQEPQKLMGQKLSTQNADSTKEDSTGASVAVNEAATVNPKDLEKSHSAVSEA
jgi:hypothetical protein